MIDRSKLLSLLGDESMVERAINIFRSDVPGQLSELQSMMNDEDWQGASRVAHTIKSQCAYLGLDNAEALAREIEHNAEREEGTNSLKSLANRLDSALSPYF